MKKLLPYKMGSASSKALAERIGIKRIKREGSRYKPKPGDTIINWGCGEGFPQNLLGVCRVLNNPAAVAVATNKLKFFRHVGTEKVSVVNWYTDRDVARELTTTGEVIVCRTKLQGSSGEGIVLATTPDEVVAAPLYTVYKKKKSEWRVHISGEEVIFIQEKVRKKDVPDEEVNWLIRNHSNGFVFAHKDRNPPACVVEQAGAAVAALGLDFGAVDVIFNSHENKAYVLEVNCAPGLEGETLERYAQSFK